MIGGQQFRLHANLEKWNREISIYLFDGDSIATSITFSKRKDGEFCDPTLRIDHHAAQVLMDELWQCGLRPTQGKQSEGVTAAQARHLDDMRAIVSHKLGVKLDAAE